MVIMVAWCRMHFMYPHVIFRFAKPKHLGDCFAGGGCYETSSPALGIWLLLWGLTWGWVKTYNFPTFSISWGMGWKYLYLTPYLGMNIHKSQLFPSYFDILQDTRLSMHSQMDEIPSSWGPLQPGWCLVDAGVVLCGTFMCLMHCLPNLPRKHMPLCCYHCYYGIVLNEMSTTGGCLRCFWPMRCATAGRRGAPELQEEISRMKVD